MKTDLFELTVEVPTIVKKGESYKIRESLKYIGFKKEFGRGAQFIYSRIYDDAGEYVPNIGPSEDENAIWNYTEIFPYDEFNEEYELTFQEEGIYTLVVSSSEFLVSDDFFKEEDVTGKFLEEGKIIMEPIAMNPIIIKVE
ncbi:hypothetical protein HNQ94_000138 [Salirhabdus euzebyi]|uniref:Uncharacterized protein n=1 Tax=Salirhabdus euzebyi TaxID=394506 RepID=A0A841PS13_9BACI|nr:hypothetical protein [Salirhabdus euzebyi]MBB6451717.1 hypothetical protein [Salirhabdus euzebyi]